MKVIDTCPWIDGYPILEVEFPSTVTPVTAQCTIWDLNTPGTALGTVAATVGLTNGAVLDTQGAAVIALVDLRIVRSEHYRFDFQALDGGGLPIGEVEPVLVNANSASDEEAMYGGAVWMQAFNDSTGASMGFALTTPGVFEFGYGSRTRPVNNWADLFTVKAALGYRRLKVGGSVQCPTPVPVTALEGVELYSWGSGTLTPNGVTVNLGRSDVQVALNNWNGGGYAGSCKIQDSKNATWFGGSPEYVDGFIEGTQTLGAGSWDMTYNRCTFRNAVLDWGLTNRGSTNTYNVIDARGSFTVEGVVAGGVVQISGLNMSVTIGTTVDPTAVITVTGTGSVTDNRNPLAPGYVAVTHVPGTALATDVAAAQAAIQVDTTAILADTSALDARVPASPAAVGDVTSAQAAVQADIAALNDIDQAGVQAALTAQGYTAARAVFLDELDAPNMPADTAAILADTAAIDARLPAAPASSGDVAAAQAAVQADIAALNDLSSADVQSAMTAQGYTAARAALLDRLVPLVAASLTAAGGSTTSEVRTGATQADNFYDNMLLVVVNAAGVAARVINSFANTNGAFTLANPLPFTPAGSDPVYVMGIELLASGGGGGTDWTTAELEQIRGALGIVGTQTAPAGGGTLQAVASDAAAALVDTAAIDARLPAAPAAVGDVSAAQAAVQSDIAALTDIDQAGVQAALTAQGLTAGRAAFLDELDAPNLPATADAILVDTAALEGRVPAAPAATGDVTAAQAAVQADIAALNDLDSAAAQAAAAAAIVAASLATSANVAAAQAAIQADISALNDLDSTQAQAAAAAAIAAAALATAANVTASQAAVQSDISALNDLSPAEVQAALRTVVYTYTFTVAAGATTTVVPTDATQADGYFDSYYALVTDGAQVAVQSVQGFLTASGQFTLDSALPFTPSPGATVQLVGLSLAGGGAGGAATPGDVLASQAAVQADIAASQSAIQADVATRATPANVAASQAAVQADVAGVPTAVRDVSLTGSASGSLGEVLLVLFALAGKSNVRLDNFTYVTTPPSAQMPNGGRFLSSVRIRVFASASAAGTSTPNAPGSEGAIYTVTLTGVQDSVHLDLPDTILGLLT